ncbi:MAG: zf-TFIIB domain-containing protein [Planctomycetes bacterium]|nr:zf-TFIIB domain-containing protein [Planctomycetota bacterium]
MDCTNCGAPLPATSNLCTFCDTLNEVDLRGIPRRSGPATEGERNCPQCDQPLAVVGLQVGGGMSVDQCNRCHGLFFDPGELETLIDDSVSHVYEIDFKRLTNLVEEEGPRDLQTVQYVRCPECGKMMNRKSYGPRSGVIVDRCREHGIWLNGRELNLLLKWTKAGGQIHKKETMIREEGMKKLKSEVLKHARASDYMEPRAGFDTSGLFDVVRVLFRLMR